LLALLSFTLHAHAITAAQIQGMEATIIVEGDGVITGELNPGQEITLHMLSFKEREGQQILELTEELYIGDQTIIAEHEEDEFGNQFALFRITELPAQEFSYKIEARVKTFVDKTIQDYDLSQSIDEQQDFLEATEYIESNEGTIRTITQQNFTSDSSLQTLGDVTSWVNGYVTYNLAYAGKIVPSTEVLREKQGVCDEYANLAAAILRAKGIPIRFVVGLVFNGEREEYHAWLQAYLPGQGWLDLDPTYNEAGTVDGSHILLGVFQDHSQAGDKITFPQNIDVELSERVLFQPGVDQNNVQIHDFDFYPEFLALEWVEHIELQEGQLTDLNFTLTNQTPDLELVSARLVMHDDFEVKHASRMLLIEPQESQTLTFSVLPLAQIPEDIFMAYDYRFETPAQTAEGTINVYPAEINGLPQVEVESIIPIIGEQGIELMVELKNYSPETQNIRIDLKKIRAFDETIAAQSQRTFVYVLPTNLREVSISITGENLDYETTIPLLETIPLDNGLIDGNQPIEDENILYVPEKVQQELLLNALTLGKIFVVIIAVILILVSLFKKKAAKKQ
jgi:transglutaminase-like putative cysteine protease